MGTITRRFEEKVDCIVTESYVYFFLKNLVVNDFMLIFASLNPISP